MKRFIANCPNALQKIALALLLLQVPIGALAEGEFYLSESQPGYSYDTNTPEQTAEHIAAEPQVIALANAGNVIIKHKEHADCINQYMLFWNIRPEAASLGFGDTFTIQYGIERTTDGCGTSTRPASIEVLAYDAAGISEFARSYLGDWISKSSCGWLGLRTEVNTGSVTVQPNEKINTDGVISFTARSTISYRTQADKNCAFAYFSVRFEGAFVDYEIPYLYQW